MVFSSPIQSPNGEISHTEWLNPHGAGDLAAASKVLLHSAPPSVVQRSAPPEVLVINLFKISR